MARIALIMLPSAPSLRDPVFIAALRRTEVDHLAVHGAGDAGCGGDVGAAHRIFLEFPACRHGGRLRGPGLRLVGVVGTDARENTSEDRSQQEKQEQRKQEPDDEKTNQVPPETPRSRAGLKPRAYARG